MKSRIFKWSAVLLLCGLVASFALAQQQGQRGGGFSGGQGNAPAGWYGKSVALVVGIDSYSQGWTPLHAAVLDAQRMKTALEGQGFAVTALFNQQATSANIIGKLRELGERTTKDDRFIFYFAGHSFTQAAAWDETQQEGYLVPVEARQGQVAGYIAMTQLRTEIMNYCHAKHVLLILDSCFSGALLTRGNIDTGAVSDYLRKRGIYGITAGQADQPALDGLFTGVLIRGLSGEADADNDGFVSFHELGLYVERGVRASNRQQTPDFGVMNGAGQMVFHCGDMGGGEAPTPTPRPTSTPQPQPQAAGGMVQIPGGTFMMGCSPGDSECDGYENPRHQVTLRPFWMDTTEVTQAEYQRAMGNNPSNFFGCADCPVEKVSWNDAQSYCSRVGKRLPTEAEWEYAARGGTDSARYGDLDAIAWYGSNSGSRTHPVGKKQPNAYGLYDMLGNAWEWCADWFGSYTSSTSNNPQGPSSGTARVLRGGSWYGSPRLVRASTRLNSAPGSRTTGIGFRCSRD